MFCVAKSASFRYNKNTECKETDKYMDFAVIEQFAHGGMSSGGVDNVWWTE